MNKVIYILIMCFLVLSCNQNSSKVEKEYITSLEERISALEKVVGEIEKKKLQEPIQSNKKLEDYFTIGSTMDKVIEVMGEPSSYMKTAPEARRLFYGLSSVYFYKDKVISYDNLEDNLKVKVK